MMLFYCLTVSTYHLKKSNPEDVNVNVFMNSSDEEISSYTAEKLAWSIRKCQDLVVGNMLMLYNQSLVAHLLLTCCCCCC